MDNKSERSERVDILALVYLRATYFKVAGERQKYALR